ncbi:hypothetical protein [Paenibacillus sinopodophylli]|uniref:hypothetical protein n=1 Tax=Paenibacillus sinopodophylli TaxID=1837342 RepID=UPI00110C9071|nr:hypothetical protein [Paenibacillus sinopodophylli]
MKLMIYLIMLLIGLPAVLFSVLVMGLTEDLKSGVMMLLSASALFILIRLNYTPTAHEPRQTTRRRYRLKEDIDFGRIIPKANRATLPPPPLCDIYREMNVQDVETEELYRLIIECDPRGE